MADWSCRRSQISNLIKGYEAGDLPGRPPRLTATYSRVNNTGNLTVTAGWDGNTISWSNVITYPSNGTAPRGGWPMIVTYDGLSIPVPDGVTVPILPSQYSLTISQVGVITYPNSLIGQQNSSPASRGVGLYYNLYGNVTASAMMAWVWGASRLIDVLEQTPQAQVNTRRLGVTGCSRNGKGALMAGAFETRFALTIPQESGSGGMSN